jgi:hypothetical protein
MLFTPAAWQNQIENCNDRQRHQRDENEALGLRNILQRHPLRPTVVMTLTCARLKRRRHDQLNLINPYGLIAILSDQSAGRRFVKRATQSSGMIQRVLKSRRENAHAATRVSIRMSTIWRLLTQRSPTTTLSIWSAISGS